MKNHWSHWMDLLAKPFDLLRIYFHSTYRESSWNWKSEAVTASQHMTLCVLISQ
jgi:hypothetical protein